MNETQSGSPAREVAHIAHLSELEAALIAALEACEREAALRSRIANERDTVTAMELHDRLAVLVATAHRLRDAALRQARGQA